MNFIVNLIFLLAGSDQALLMPITDSPKETFMDCQAMGFSAYEYALSFKNENGLVPLTLPDGTKVLVEVIGWGCAPQPWTVPTAAE